MTERAMKISAVIPAYNCEKYITRAIDSVLNQTRPVDEIIVVDDGSADGTAEVVSFYGDKVHLIQQENAGASAARNTGIKVAAGNWIAFLDADDEWLPNMLELQCNVLKQCPDLMWSTGNYKMCFCQKDYDLIKNDPQRIQKLLDNKLYFNDFFDAYIHKSYGCTNCMVVRKIAFQEAGFFNSALTRAEDIDMWFRIAYRYPRIGYVSEPLAIYHMETGESLCVRPVIYNELKEFLQRHLDLSCQNDKFKIIKPIATKMMQSWIRSSFFDDRVYDIRKAVRSFKCLLSGKYKFLIYFMTIFPGVTKIIFGMLSWLSQKFRLRRQRWHSTERYKHEN